MAGMFYNRSLKAFRPNFEGFLVNLANQQLRNGGGMAIAGGNPGKEHCEDKVRVEELLLLKGVRETLANEDGEMY